ncbi:MAG: pyridoxal phosphate-dependent transferase [Benniella sp.]|nr:MAG: pyridoxal phosphate-dependent transferase [Benniella sp.]
MFIKSQTQFTQAFRSEIDSIKAAGIYRSQRVIVIARSEKSLDTHGSSLSVRFMCGTQNIHKDLENQISKFYGTEDTILYFSCFDVNAGTFEAILTDQDAVDTDALNHANIIDGVRLCGTRVLRCGDCDMADLEARLQEADKAGVRLKLIATDGVFSMDGKIAPLDKICELPKVQCLDLCQRLPLDRILGSPIQLYISLVIYPSWLRND